MDRELIDTLKGRLLHEVACFYRRDDRLWKRPVVDTLRDLQRMDAEAVFFGGTLRSLLISRVFAKRPGRPRDIDIVVTGTSLASLKDHFLELISRETRFGGLQLRRHDWQFDLWPLKQTWAFVNDVVEEPTFSALPSTTFFNLEAIAVEMFPQKGRPRRIFSGDDQFFQGIVTRTIEINREDNPFPELCVVRGLIMASGLDFSIGPRLAGYIARHGEHMTPDALDCVQHKHYGKCRQAGQTLRAWIEKISDLHSAAPMNPIDLPLARQLHFWNDRDDHSTHVQLRALRR